MIVKAPEHNFKRPEAGLRYTDLAAADAREGPAGHVASIAAERSAPARELAIQVVEVADSTVAADGHKLVLGVGKPIGPLHPRSYIWSVVPAATAAALTIMTVVSNIMFDLQQSVEVDLHHLWVAMAKELMVLVDRTFRRKRCQSHCAGSSCQW